MNTWRKRTGADLFCDICSVSGRCSDAMHLGSGFLNLDKLYERIGYCKLLADGSLTDSALKLLVRNILLEKGPLPVGEIGKLIQEATAAPNITSVLKEKYGGLKKFLENIRDCFVLR